MAIKSMDKAKLLQNDEFYTKYEDIAKELQHYRQYFNNKIVYCNCDNYEISNFYKYFVDNFNSLGLKKLICTHYKTIDLFTVDDARPVKVELTAQGLIKTPLQWNGDFNSTECTNILADCDIVVSNPPFSLFRAYINTLISYDKKFIVVGNINATSYNNIFNLIKNKKIWLGVNSGSMSFIQPSGIDKPVFCAWFTNLQHNQYPPRLTLKTRYTPEQFPQYENYDAINIDKLNEIPADYYGKMGVPITLLPKFNPTQFEIIALGITGSIKFTSNILMEILDNSGNGTGEYTRNAKGNLYRKHNPTTDKPPAYKNTESGELYQSIYARIIIQLKH